MLKNLGKVLLFYVCGYFAKSKNADSTCLDKFRIPSNVESLNSAYHVLHQNDNKIENLSSFAECTACMQTGNKLSSSD